MRIFVTSDTHFSHKNIIQYCNRPFSSVDEMNAAIIRMWNEQVVPDDVVLFLGDFVFARTAQAEETTRYFANSLHGRKIIVTGNHDFKKLDYTQCGFIGHSHGKLELDGMLFEHNPAEITSEASHYRKVYYGHVHNTPNWIPNIPHNCINACLDANNFKLLDITDEFTNLEWLKEYEL